MPIVRGLDAQLALRFDEYSDFGSTTNPKVALRWQPTADPAAARLVGRRFSRAAAVHAERADGLGRHHVIEDPVRCPVTGLVDDCLAFVEVFSGGNPNLQPETSTQWNLGVVWEPVRGLSLGVDYWAIEQKGIIEPLTEENLMRYYQRFPDRITRGPVDPVYPDLPGPIVAIDISPINLGTTQTSRRRCLRQLAGAAAGLGPVAHRPAGHLRAAMGNADRRRDLCVTAR